MYMLVMVLDDISHLDEVLHAWLHAGVQGITIVESTGVNRVLQRGEAQAAFAGFGRIFGSGRIGHNTLFAIIDSLEVAEAVAEATKQVVGDLTQPNTGLVFALPVAQTWGLPQPAQEHLQKKDDSNS